jgi:hypothetical protein
MLIDITAECDRYCLLLFIVLPVTATLCAENLILMHDSPLAYRLQEYIYCY